ncbi:hypothetical protein OC834_004513 [Tilletia horrida]|nr:hypothetical protein OC834_004513 [Tilletia horrida]
MADLGIVDTAMHALSDDTNSSPSDADTGSTHSGSSDAASTDEDGADEDEVPPSLPPETPRQLAVLYERSLSLLLPSSSPLVRQGFSLISETMALALSRARILRTHSISICTAVLYFLRLVAAQEKRAGVPCSPGTAAAYLLSRVVRGLGEFHSFVREVAHDSFVKRARKAESRCMHIAELMSAIGAVVQQAKKDLNLPHIAPSHLPSIDGNLRASLTSLRDVLWSQEENIITRLSDCITETTILAFIRECGEPEAPPFSTSPSPPLLPTPSQCVSYRDTDLELLELVTRRQARQVRSNILARIRQLAHSGPLTQLLETFSLSCAVGLIKHTYTLAYVIATEVYHRYQCLSSSQNRWRLVNALAALSIALREAGQLSEAVRVSQHAVELYAAGFDSTSTDGVGMMGLLQLEYSRNLFAQWDNVRSSRNKARQLYASAQQAGIRALDQFRRVQAVNANCISWAAELNLGRALHHHANLSRYSMGSRAPYQDPDALMTEAIDWIQKAAKRKPLLIEQYLVGLLGEHAGNFACDPEDVIDLCRDAIDICQRWSAGWEEEMAKKLSQQFFLIGWFQTDNEDWVQVEEASSTAIELDARIGEDSSHCHLLRARARVRNGHFLAALSDAQQVTEPTSIVPYATPTAAAIEGFALWMVAGGLKAKTEEALQTLRSAIDFWHREGYADKALPLEHIDVKDYRLALAWYGAIECVMGKMEAAKKNGKRAVQLALGADGLDTESGQAALARALLFYAATLFQADARVAAKTRIERAIKAMRKAGGRLEAPTARTVWLIAARIYEAGGELEDAAQAREEANQYKCLGYAHRLGVPLS